jgi:hypothetical protein
MTLSMSGHQFDHHYGQILLPTIRYHLCQPDASNGMKPNIRRPWIFCKEKEK